jgi:hypothetical protein
MWVFRVMMLADGGKAITGKPERMRALMTIWFNSRAAAQTSENPRQYPGSCHLTAFDTGWPPQWPKEPEPCPMTSCRPGAAAIACAISSARRWITSGRGVIGCVLSVISEPPNLTKTIRGSAHDSRPLVRIVVITCLAPASIRAASMSAVLLLGERAIMLPPRPPPESFAPPAPAALAAWMRCSSLGLLTPILSNKRWF